METKWEIKKVESGFEIAKITIDKKNNIQQKSSVHYYDTNGSLKEAIDNLK